MVIGFLVQVGSWVAPFIVAAGLLVVGAAVWAFWLDPEKSVLEQPETMAAKPAGA
jgi:hypothetical protein